MLRNLLDNAARHAASEVTAQAGACGENAVIHIDDDGPGIAAADRIRVFDRFVRLDADRSRSAGGPGLGLAIVREIVAAQHGNVAITDRPGGGTRVTVQLPLAYAPESSR
jgi:signal transduction histidine kinase